MRKVVIKGGEIFHKYSTDPKCAGGESGGEVGDEGSDTDWNMTVRGLPSDFDYSEPVNSVGGGGEGNGWGEEEERAARGEERRERSPSKEVGAALGSTAVLLHCCTLMHTVALMNNSGK